ncbi:MAG: hypothetical protein ABIJ97_15075 [Bacteroidota bacterium]
MKIFSLILGTFILLYAFSGCDKEDIYIQDGFYDDSSIKSIEGTWKIISYQDFVNDTSVYKHDIGSDSLDVIISFEDKMFKNILSGTNTTNSISGEYKYKSKREIKIKFIVTTLISEPEWGQMFSAISSQIKEFKINSAQLRFYYNNQNNSVTLDKVF